MSWSFMGTGKPGVLATKARTEMTRVKCIEPEETIKLKALDVIETSLAVFPKMSAVEVLASGSQWSDGVDSTVATNTLSLSIKPIFGFVE